MLVPRAVVTAWVVSAVNPGSLPEGEVHQGAGQSAGMPMGRGIRPASEFDPSVSAVDDAVAAVAGVGAGPHGVGGDNVAQAGLGKVQQVAVGVDGGPEGRVALDLGDNSLAPAAEAMSSMNSE